MAVTKKREKQLRAMVDAVEAERMKWAKKVIDGLVADGVERRRICFDMTDDKVFMAIGVDRGAGRRVRDCLRSERHQTGIMAQTPVADR